jgi:Flp pilus assembly pilin Flp
MIEYGLIIALISIAAIALLVLFKAPLQALFSNAVSSLS